MKNTIKTALIFLFLALMFSVAVSGGCGGSSSHSGYSQNEEPNPDIPEPEIPDEPNLTRDVWEEDTVISLLNANDGFDFDGDGKMEFLDFDGVPQYHLSKNVNASGLPRNSSYRAASELKITVPAMVWLKELQPQNENPNIFQVYLEKTRNILLNFQEI